jgi:phosphoribosylanthranilate isomerase
MTWVKICGMTNLEDALTAVEAGADAMGFVFYEKSPRKISVEAAREIVERLPESVEKVGVFVGPSAVDVDRVAEQVGLTAVQLYPAPKRGGEPAGVWQSPVKKYVTLPVRWVVDPQGRFKGFAWGKEAERLISAIFLDSGTSKHPGGTGKKFDWKRASQAVRALSLNFNVVVAGGLTPANVEEAIGVLKPWGVDVASGVEERPGKKDPEKVRAFVKAVRDADRETS